LVPGNAIITVLISKRFITVLPTTDKEREKKK